MLKTLVMIRPLTNPFPSGYCLGGVDKLMPNVYNAFVVNVPIFGGLETLGYEDTQHATRPTRTKGTTTITSSVATTICTSTRTGTCFGNLYPQPCHHYSSVDLYNPQNAVITCPAVPPKPKSPYLPAVWKREHHDDWKSYTSANYIDPAGALKPPNCQADEWPPRA